MHDREGKENEPMNGDHRSQGRIDALRKAVALKRLRESSGVADAHAIPRADRDGPLPLSWAQRRLWFLDRLDPAAGSAYRIGVALRLHGSLDADALEGAMAAVVARHEVLRSRIVDRGGEPEMRVDSRTSRFVLAHSDLSGVAPAEREPRLQAVCAEATRMPFDLEHDAPMRARLVRLSETEHVLILVQHHIASDGWSLGLLVREVASFYTSALSGTRPALPVLPVQYADYAAWQRARLGGPGFKAKLAEWVAALADAPMLSTLPSDFPRAASPRHRGARVPVQWSPELSRSLHALAVRCGATPYSVILTAWAVLLARLGGQRDIVVGIPVANRPRVELEGLIGLFIDTLPVRIRMADGADVRSLIRTVHDELLASFERQEVPFDRIVDAVRPERSLGHGPLFQTMVAFNNTPSSNVELGGLRIEEFPLQQETASQDMTLNLGETAQGIGGWLIYDTDLFTQATAERCVARIDRLIGEMVRDPGCMVDALPLLSNAERTQVLEAFNATDRTYEGMPTVHAGFEAQVALRPEAVAVEFEGARLSYGELNARANQVAHTLIARGVVPDDRVGLCVERSLEMAVGLLGILKAGAAYVPLDPSLPGQRIQAMVADGALHAVLVHESTLPAVSGVTAPVLRLDEANGWSSLTTNPDPQALGLRPDHLAYVIYTSGSTGVPKGAMNQHDGVCNGLHWAREVFDMGPRDSVLQKTPFGFDVSVWEIFLTWSVGARLVLARPGGHQDPQYLGERIRDSGTTVLHFVPSMLEAYLRHGPAGSLSGVRAVICIGEALSGELRDRFIEAYPQVALHNAYGPAEAAVSVTWWTCRAGENGAVPIGRPGPNVRMYVLDGERRPVPLGAVGELYIGGVQVGRGYLNRPALTAERYVESPFVAGERLYRTGDLGRWRDDGALEYLGRNDFQVKLRGHRIELGEIESALRQCGGVRDAVVCARADDGGTPRLVAYVEVAPGADLEVDGLRAALAVRLPEYMVPAAYVAMEAWPLSVNGKLDRNRLPAPGIGAYTQRAYAAPEGEAESTLARVWSQVLGIPRVGRHDNFFELGGDSMQVLRLVEPLSVAGWDLLVRDVFSAPTLAALAQRMNESEPAARQIVVPPTTIPEGADHIAPHMLPLVTLSQANIDAVSASVPGGAGNIQDIYPLAPLQEGILFHHLLQTRGDTYLLRTVVGFDSRERLDDFLGELQATIDRHDVLRTVACWEGLPEPVQVVLRQARLRRDILSPVQGQSPRETLEAHTDPTCLRLDLREGPLVRAYAIPDEGGAWLLAIVNHHFVSDHITLASMVEEIGLRLAGMSDALPPVVPFRDFVARIRMAGGEGHEAYFRRVLGDVHEPTAPFGILDTRDAGAAASEERLPLRDDVGLRLCRLSRTRGAPVAAFFHAAWAMTLAACTGRGDVVFGSVLSGRMQEGADAARAMGVFVNTLPLRVALGEADAGALLEHTQAGLAELLQHEQASLALAQRCSGVEAPMPLFTSLLNLRRVSPLAGANEPLGVRVYPGRERSNYPLTVSVDMADDAFSLLAMCAPGIDAAAMAERYACAIERLLDAVESGDATSASRLSVLPPSEHARLVSRFNDTEVPFRRDDLIHSGFERHARTAPDAVAVSTRDGQCTYGDLNASANRIAHRLLAMGLQPGERVAICVQRGIPMIAALLGIVKAGGAYVPLDPAYPADRLAYMLQDSEPAVLVTDSRLLDDPDVLGTVALSMQIARIDDEEAFAAHPSHDPDAVALGVQPTQLAYVIYTSGSTGLPKGVMVQHRPAVNLFEWVAATFDVGADDALLFTTSLCFDLSVYDIFGMLSVGGRIRVADRDEVADPRALVHVLRHERITFWDSAPAVFSRLVPYLAQGEPSPWLRLAFFSGDWIPLELPDAVRKAFPNCRPIGLGGATEAVVWSNYFPIDQVDPNWSSIPYGRPIQNARYYVLDAYLNPVPEGVPGDLYIGGECLSTGYFRREALTAERYPPDPFNPTAQARMYRTGDRARHRPDGQLEFLGRLDGQVKIRGFRIELGEIEAQLLTGEEIRAALVTVHEFAPADRRLVAYVIPAEPDTWSAAATRDRIAARLPDYMVPSAFVALEAFPLTANGKVDRASLPSPEDGGGQIHRRYEEPVGEAETQLASAWAALLGVERVGRLDSFFELGGHSLVAIALIEQLRQAGHALEVRAVFEAPVLSQMARRLRPVDDGLVPVVTDMTGHSRIPYDAPSIDPGMLDLAALTQAQIDRVVDGTEGGASNIQDIYPLAPLQEGILFHHLLGGEGDAYLLRSVIAFADRSRAEAFLVALQEVIDRHDILRTALHWEGVDEPLQVVRRHAALPRIEHPPEASHGAATTRLLDATDPHRTRMDLRRAPLLAAHLVGVRDTGEWLLGLLAHHAVCDHVTLAMAMREVVALLDGDQALPPALPYRRFIAQALSLPRQFHVDHFRARLSDVSETTAPFGAIDVQGDGHELREAVLALPETLCGKLRRRARHAGVLPAALFHLAWARVLAACVGRDDVVFGTVLSGRLQGVEGAGRALGVFINTLPVRIRVRDVDARNGIVDDEALRAVQDELNALLAHEQAPLSLAQRCSAVAPPIPLFTTLLNYRRGEAADSRALSALSLHGMRVVAGGERTNYPIAIAVDDTAEGFSILVQCARSVHGTEPSRLMGYLCTALEALADSQGTDTGSLDILPAAERTQVLEAFNATDRTYEGMPTVHAGFEAQVALRPEAVAVEFEGARLSYGELNARANQVAHTLIARGVVPDDRVGLCVERSLEMAVGLLGILKAGAAYVPLDPSLPGQRIQAMVADGALHAVLVHESTLPAVSGVTAPVLRLDEANGWSSLTTNPDPQALGLRPDHLAYVIYTSGSTGVPKGAMNQHDGVCNRLHWAREVFGMGPRDSVLQKTPFGFDVSVWEIFLTWSVGARLVLARPGGHQDPQYLGERIRDSGTTVLHFVPSMLEAYLRHGPAGSLSGVRAVICSGEALSGELRDRFIEAYPQVALHNAYGPTEAAVDVTWWTCRAGEGGAVPIGRPAPNVRMYVLDGERRPVPLGAVGELYIGGVQVGRGYLNRPALTAERYVESPFVAGERLYRTGDLGRWRDDGALEYLGRNDFQVKLRGHRIELGEIESALRQCGGVRDAVVCARTDNGGTPRLVAYVEVVPGADLEVDGLRAVLAARLPEYMVPAAYVAMEAWPLSVNGKLDRNRLPAPGIGAYTQRAYAAPEGEAESTLARVWSQVLGVPRVGRHDNFFELGGDSIRSIAVVARAREEGIGFAIADMFKAPTVAELARIVGGGHGATPRPRPLSPEDIARLPAGLDDAYAATLLQQGMIFHALRAPDSGAYHDVFSYELELPQWREDVMRSALDAATMRHPVLRTGFVHGSYSEPLQLVHAHARLPLEVHDVRHLDSREQRQAIDDALSRERARGFDLANPPLCRVFVHLIDDRRIRYTMSFHHAILDGWSVASLQTELFSHYLRMAAGESVEAKPSPAASPADAVALEQAALADPRQEAFWRHTLDGFHRTSLPIHDGDEASVGHYHSQTVTVDDDDEHALRELAQTMGVPVRTLLLTAHLRVLASLGGSEDVTTGLVSNVRPEAEDGDQVLGLFLNTLPLRAHLAPCRWRDLIMQVHQAELSAIEHRYYPYFRLHRDHGGAPLFDAIFNYVNFHVYGSLEGAELRVLGATVHEWTGYPLDVSFAHTGGRLTLQVNADPARWSAAQTRRMVGYLARTIAALAHSPEAGHDVFALPGDDEATALGAWGSAPPLACDGPGEPATLYAGIAAQARLRPDALAIVDGDVRVSYAELDARADVLAGRLRRCGALPGTRVVLSLPRGADVIVGMLGILKSGAAYVPIDPVYPDARIADTLRDCSPIAVLADRTSEPRLRALCGEQTVEVLAIDDIPAATAEPSGPEQGDGVMPSDPAYVIYTSGSTGRPKGVVVEHRNAVHLVRNHLHLCRLDTNDRVMQYATYSFDTSVEEIFPTLWAGATLVMRPSRLIAPDADFHRFLREERITVADLPTAFWHRWVQALVRADGYPEEGVEQSLRLVVVGGEKAEPALLQQWRARPAWHSTRWLNTYGPTETTVYATAQDVECGVSPRDEDGSIGRPIPGTRVRVVDSYGQAAPLGAVGELWIGGDGVARGYFNRPELTETRFLEDTQGMRWYRTGDLARWRHQGVLEYMGRNDSQVKLRGYRIELGEIEAAMMECAALREAVVMVRRDGDGEPRLVAYAVPASSDALDTFALRTSLAERLPEYMVPAVYVPLASLPLTPSGKIDRSSLPAPSTAATRTAYEAPWPGAESIIAEVWASLLGLPRIGRHDHFFELGGHSLMIVAMIERLGERGMALDVQAVFDAPTLSQLATHVTAADALGDDLHATPPNPLETVATRIDPSLLPLVDMDQSDIDALTAAVPGGAENIQDVYPLGTLQTGILFHHLIHQEGDPYLLRYVMRLADRDRLDRLVEHLQCVIDRHDALRTCVHWEGLLQPVQVVLRQARLPVVELTLDESGDAVSQMFALTDPRALKKDLRAAPLLEARYARDPDGGWLLAILVHHMVSDHVTQNLILDEVDLLLGGRGDLLRPPVPYRTFIAAQRFASPAAQRRYFGERFADLETPTIAFGMPEVRGTGQSVVAVHEPMPPALAAGVRLAAQRLGVAPAVLFHVGWAHCLAHLVGNDDVVFGTVLSGRLQGVQGAGRAMGVFINTLPVRLQLSGLSLRATVELAFSELRAILRHEQAPLALAQRCSKVSAREPLFNTLLNYRHSPIASPDVVERARETWQGVELILGEERTNYPVAVSVDDQGAGHGFVISVQCVAGIDPAAVCAMTMGAMSRIVAGLESCPEEPLARIDVEWEVEA